MSNGEPEIICPSGFNRPAAGRSFIQWLTYGIIKAPNISNTASWSMPFFNSFNRSHHHCKLETNQLGMRWLCQVSSIHGFIYITFQNPLHFSLSLFLSSFLILNYFISNRISHVADIIIKLLLDSFFLRLEVEYWNCNVSTSLVYLNQRLIGYL